VKSSSAGQCRSHSSAISSVNRRASCTGGHCSSTQLPCQRKRRAGPTSKAVVGPARPASQPRLPRPPCLPSRAHLGPAVVGHHLLGLAKVELQVLVHRLARLIGSHAATRRGRGAAAGVGRPCRRRRQWPPQAAPQGRQHAGRCGARQHQKRRSMHRLAAAGTAARQHGAVGTCGGSWRALQGRQGHAKWVSGQHVVNGLAHCARVAPARQTFLCF
jgi:hypothetical protein